MTYGELTEKNLRAVAGYEPRTVFEYFARLSSLPHGSGNTGKISALCGELGGELGLDTFRDGLGNVIIKKKGSAGRENEPPVILQAHIDMVCAAEPGCGRDMAETGVEFAAGENGLSAVGTSLGGDDCIGAAMIFALLADGTLSHPPVEAVFTVDEETGMFGANGLDMGLLSGKRMINIDSENENVITAGCAGGVRVKIKAEPAGGAVAPAPGDAAYEICLSGLRGGHSGVEINLGRGNAAAILARALGEVLPDNGRLASFGGGRFDNVIMDSCRAEVVIPGLRGEGFAERAAEALRRLISEYPAEDGARISVSETVPRESLGAEDTANLISLMTSLPQGVVRMSPDMPGLVQTSLNLGCAEIGKNGASLSFSVRSSSGDEKKELAGKLAETAAAHGAAAELSGDYPGWRFQPVSPLREAFEDVCGGIYGRKPVTVAIHAGLECGFFSERIPGLDCVSVGPDIRDIHTPGETLDVASTERTYRVLKKVLGRI